MHPVPSLERLEFSHFGFLVDDVPGTVERWANVYGVGPFFYGTVSYENALYRGEPVELNEVFAFGKVGGTFVDVMALTFGTPVPELRDLPAAKAT